MIVFKRVAFKNFLSTGNTETEVYLNRVPSILITGQNGAGKSTILDAITYGLYGKPYRNINKPQLVNSVNEKGLLVTLDFEINGVDYRVIRGIKPGVFEIYRNGDLLQHDAAIKDYQTRLENIVGMNYKAFTQIVILGSARYQSFMDLSSNDRRTIIEEILDITVFSKMNSVLKAHSQATELDLKENDYQKEINKTKATGQKSLITSIQNRAKESADKIEEEKEKIDEELSQLSAKVDSISDALKDLVEPDLNNLHDKMSEVKMKGHELRKREKTANDKIIFYENSYTCEVCQQEISDDVKHEHIHMAKIELETLSKAKKPMAEAFEKLQTKIDGAGDIIKEIRTLETERRGIMGEIKTLESMKRNLRVATKDTDADDLNEALLELQTINDRMKELERNQIRLIEEKHNQEICKVLLKDDGIKAKIIKQYLPVMNKLINKFLDRMGANYSFHLDEQFNEVIKSRYRDNFSYASFSEGEKQRIDLALMFTWREIAKIKNSIATNLLILDEIGDSSMDGEGTDVLWEILNDMKDTNIFVISHKTSNVDKFSSHIEIYKEGNFSKIRNSK